MVPGNRVRVNGHKLKYGKFHSSIRKKTFLTVRVSKYCHGLPGYIVESTYIEIIIPDRTESCSS